MERLRYRESNNNYFKDCDIMVTITIDAYIRDTGNIDDYIAIFKYIPYEKIQKKSNCYYQVF